jgi:hypothetical protein
VAGRKTFPVPPSTVLSVPYGEFAEALLTLDGKLNQTKTSNRVTAWRAGFVSLIEGRRRQLHFAVGSLPSFRIGNFYERASARPGSSAAVSRDGIVTLCAGAALALS